MSRLLITVGIVTWNSAADLPDCLQALISQEGVDLELVVVDNASRDDSIEIVERFFPDARIIRNSENRGFCGGHNQGIRAASGAFYMPLNPDVVLQSNYLKAAVSAMDVVERVGMVAGRLLLGKPGGTPALIDSTGLFMDRRRRQYLRSHGEPDDGQYLKPEEVFGVDGSAPLYRRSMLDEIQVDGEYFDEAFFAHKEDVDLSWRARLLGWRCWYTSDAVAYHNRTFRPGQRKALSEEIRLDAVKNRYLLLMKNEIKEGWRRDWLPIVWYDLKILAYLFLFERSSLRGLKQAWRLKPRMDVWRAEIMRRRKISAEEMLNWFR